MSKYVSQLKHEDIPQIIDHLMYASYKANRGYGMQHEQLVKLGIGNDTFKQIYELEQIVGPEELYL